MSAPTESTDLSGWARRHPATAGWIAAAVAYAVGALVLAGSTGRWAPARDAGGPGHIALRLVPPPERVGTDVPPQAPTDGMDAPDAAPPDTPPPSIPPPGFDAVAYAPPTPSPEPSPAGTPAPAPLADDIRAELERERASLKSSLARRDSEMADTLAKLARDSPPPSPSDASPPGAASGAAPPNPGGQTVRELDFSGWPQDVVNDVMARHGLKITEKALSGGVSQSFLSSAATADGNRFTADRAGAPGAAAGVYNVFLLSPQAVAHMARTEEEALRARGFEPERARVTRVKFGITGNPPDLGVTGMDAVPVP